jgi:hypothetical protein
MPFVSEWLPFFGTKPTLLEPQTLAAAPKPRKAVPDTNMEQFSVTCLVGDGIILGLYQRNAVAYGQCRRSTWDLPSQRATKSNPAKSTAKMKMT